MAEEVVVDEAEDKEEAEDSEPENSSESEKEVMIVEDVDAFDEVEVERLAGGCRLVPFGQGISRWIFSSWDCMASNGPASIRVLVGLLGTPGWEVFRLRGIESPVT